jgi:hypothetical protein
MLTLPQINESSYWASYVASSRAPCTSSSFSGLHKRAICDPIRAHLCHLYGFYDAWLYCLQPWILRSGCQQVYYHARACSFPHSCHCCLNGLATYFSSDKERDTDILVLLFIRGLHRNLLPLYGSTTGPHSWRWSASKGLRIFENPTQLLRSCTSLLD